MNSERLAHLQLTFFEVPGDDFFLPIEAVNQNRIRVQPDSMHLSVFFGRIPLTQDLEAGFGYRWSQPIKWEDLREVRRTSGLTVRCPHMDKKEAPFHFTVFPAWNSHARYKHVLHLVEVTYLKDYLGTILN